RFLPRGRPGGVIAEHLHLIWPVRVELARVVEDAEIEPIAQLGVPAHEFSFFPDCHPLSPLSTPRGTGVGPVPPHAPVRGRRAGPREGGVMTQLRRPRTH